MSNNINDYGDLNKEPAIVQKTENFKKCVKELKVRLNVFLANDVLDTLDTTDQIRNNLFVSYALCSLYWMHFKTNGILPGDQLKNEIKRVEKHMNRLNSIIQKHRRPKVDQEAAKRFIRHGLSGNNQKVDQPPLKKLKVCE